MTKNKSVPTSPATTKPLPEYRLATLNHAYWKHARWFAREMDWKRKQQEVHGSRFRVTRDVCECGSHYKIVVCNGDCVGPPLCPKVVGLRRTGAALRNGQQPDYYLISDLLRRAHIEETL